MQLPFAVQVALKQGADWTYTWQYQTGSPPAPVDLTGASARMMLRQQYSDAVAALSLTTTASANGQIALQNGLSTVAAASAGVTGYVTVTITKAAASALACVTYDFDLFIDWPNGTSTPLLTGEVTVAPAFTH